MDPVYPYTFDEATEFLGMLSDSGAISLNTLSPALGTETSLTTPEEHLYQSTLLSDKAFPYTEPFTEFGQQIPQPFAPQHTHSFAAASVVDDPRTLTGNSLTQKSKLLSPLEIDINSYPPKKLPPSRVEKPVKKDRSAHNKIEKKYRTNINTRIEALRDAVPSLRMAAGLDSSPNDLDGLAPVVKINKASVLTKATEYIQHLERKNKLLALEVAELRSLMALALWPVGNQYPPLQALNVDFHGPPSTMIHPGPPPMNQQGRPLGGVMGQGGYVAYGPGPQSGHDVPTAYNYAHGHPTPSPTDFPTRSASQPGPPQRFLLPGKIVMGGMAGIIGISLYPTDLNFQGLAAFPIFNHPLLALFVHLTKISLVLYVIMILAQLCLDESQKAHSLLAWISLARSLSSPGPGPGATSVSAEASLRSHIERSLLSGVYPGWRMVWDYICMASQPKHFENVLMAVVLGKVFSLKHPLLGWLLTHWLTLDLALLAQQTDFGAHAGFKNVLHGETPFLHNDQLFIRLMQTRGETCLMKLLLRLYHAEVLQRANVSLLALEVQQKTPEGADEEAVATSAMALLSSTVSPTEPEEVVACGGLFLQASLSQSSEPMVLVLRLLRLTLKAAPKTRGVQADGCTPMPTPLSFETYIDCTCALVGLFLSTERKIEAASLLRFLNFSENPETVASRLSLRSFLALYRLLGQVPEEWYSQAVVEKTLEKLAVCARIWVGDVSEGHDDSLPHAIRAALGDTLLDYGRMINGVTP